MKKYFILILFFVLFAIPFSGLARENIFYMSNLKEKEGIISLEKNADKIDIIAPQFYGVSSSLKLEGGLDDNLKKTIQQAQVKNKNLKVMPLVANAGFKQSVIHNLLKSPKAQDKIIKSLVDIAKKEKYIGWQFDFENISYKDKDLYSAFVEKTAKAFHKNNLILSVAVVSRYVDYENTVAFKNWSGVFDYARLAEAVDFISLMTYDDPSSIGPVASLPFINNVLAYVKNKIPSHKLSFGIPLYYWGWSTDPFKKITASGSYSRLSGIMNNFQHSKGYDASLGASWLTYFWQDRQYKLWYQDKQSFQNKLDITKQNNFRGFSAWVLGVEDPEIWATLK
ncbi:MAG: glycosyl hydrolase family 18 protein [Candidatus Staskawiczbacteria bacterium]|jgi:spore germination protein YaaH